MFRRAFRRSRVTSASGTSRRYSVGIAIMLALCLRSAAWAKGDAFVLSRFVGKRVHLLRGRLRVRVADRRRLAGHALDCSTTELTEG